MGDSRISVVSIVVLSAVFFGAAVPLAAAQNNEEFNEAPRWLGAWWSWPYWWEANRPSILAAGRQVAGSETSTGSGGAGGAGVSDRRMGAVGERLLKIATNPDRHREVRVQAVISVGRMGLADALPKLKALTQKKPFKVARAAWVAMALIGGEKARATIVGDADWGGLRDRAVLPRIIAMGLLGQIEQPGLKLLAKTVTQGQAAEIRASALWALRQHDPPFLRRLSREVINETANVRLASEAILALGQHPHPDDRRLLVDLYHGYERFLTPAVTAAWDRWVFDDIGDPHEFWSTHSLWITALRTSAVMSLTQFQFPRDHRLGRRVREALRRPYTYVTEPGGQRRLWRPDDGWSGTLGPDEKGSHEIRWGNIAMGRIGYEPEARLLKKILQASRPRLVQSSPAPPRTFAALGLGLYARRRGPGDEADLNIRRTLAYYAGDENQPPKNRAAFLLALGLAGGDQAAAVHEALSARGGDLSLVRGHGAQALALLGDRSAIRVAQPMLPEPERGVPDAETLMSRWETRPVMPNTMLGLRGALHGLGILGGRSAKELAETVIGRETHTSLAAAWALRRSGAAGIVQPLMQMLDNERLKTKQRRMVLMVLGELLAARQPGRLHQRLVHNRNYTWPVARGGDSVQEKTKEWPLYRYLRFADPFLYEFLVPLPYEGQRH